MNWEVILRIVEGDFTFVTHNAADFGRLYAREQIHAGLIIVVPQVPPNLQRELFNALMDQLAGTANLINQAIEIYFDDGEVRFDRYACPGSQPQSGRAGGFRFPYLPTESPMQR